MADDGYQLSPVRLRELAEAVRRVGAGGEGWDHIERPAAGSEAGDRGWDYHHSSTLGAEVRMAWKTADERGLVSDEVLGRFRAMIDHLMEVPPVLPMNFEAIASALESVAGQLER